MKPDHDLTIGPAKFKLRYHESWEGRAIYEPEVVDVFLRFIAPGDVVFDCGANLGFFTLLASRLVGHDGLVVAFEPDLENLRFLRDNIALNDMRNVFAVDAALWCKDEWRAFYPHDHGGYSSFVQYFGCSREPRRVLARALDTLIIDTRATKPKLIKIDCEGSEEMIVRGAEKLLRANPPDGVVAELNFHILKAIGSSGVALREFMFEVCGYDTFVLEAGFKPTLVPRETQIDPSSTGYCNVLFAKPEVVERHFG